MPASRVLFCASTISRIESPFARTLRRPERHRRARQTFRVTRSGLPDNFAAFYGNGPLDGGTFEAGHHLDAFSFPEKLREVFQHLARNWRQTNCLILLGNNWITKVNLMKRFNVCNVIV